MNAHALGILEFPRLLAHVAGRAASAPGAAAVRALRPRTDREWIEAEHARVNAVRSLGIDRKDKESVFSLLAVNFTPTGEGPDGTVELVLSGNASVALDVECVEVQLADTGGAWETSLKPRHPAV